MSHIDPARRVESLFQGEFGEAYTARNTYVDESKPLFFHELFRKYNLQRVLECGCNIGLNLRHAAEDPAIQVWGIDIQATAIQRAREAMPKAQFITGSLLDIPFKDGYFDLAFTCGVLIHVPPEGLGGAMDEIYRVSNNYVLCAEYHDETEVTVPWRGHEAALWRRNYGQLYLERFPDLELVEGGYKGVDEGWDRITWQLFRKKSRG